MSIRADLPLVSALQRTTTLDDLEVDGVLAVHLRDLVPLDALVHDLSVRCDTQH